MELKKGMKVRLKFLRETDDSRVSIAPCMERFFGSVVTLATDLDYDGDFWIVEAKDHWWFSSDWVAAVIDSKGFGESGGKSKEKHKNIRLIRLRVSD